MKNKQYHLFNQEVTEIEKANVSTTATTIVFLIRDFDVKNPIKYANWMLDKTYKKNCKTRKKILAEIEELLAAPRTD